MAPKVEPISQFPPMEINTYPPMEINARPPVEADPINVDPYLNDPAGKGFPPFEVNANAPPLSSIAKEFTNPVQVYGQAPPKEYPLPEEVGMVPKTEVPPLRYWSSEDLPEGKPSSELSKLTPSELTTRLYQSETNLNRVIGSSLQYVPGGMGMIKDTYQNYADVKRELQKRGAIFDPQSSRISFPPPPEEKVIPEAPSSPVKASRGRGMSRRSSSKQVVSQSPTEPLKDPFENYQNKLNDLIADQKNRVARLGKRGDLLLGRYEEAYKDYRGAIDELKSFDFDPESLWNRMSTAQAVIMGISQGLEQTGNLLSGRPDAASQISKMLDMAQQRDLQKQKLVYDRIFQRSELSDREMERAMKRWDKLEARLGAAQNDILKLKIMDLGLAHPSERLKLADASLSLGLKRADLALKGTQIAALRAKMMGRGTGGQKLKDLPPKIRLEFADGIGALRSLDNMLGKVEQMDKSLVPFIGTKDLVPNSPQYELARELNLLAVELRKARESGVMTEADFKRYQETVNGNFTTLASIKRMLTSLRADMSMRLQTKLRAFGVPGYDIRGVSPLPSPQQQQGIRLNPAKRAK